MNVYERERAECTADEETLADRRLQAWRRRNREDAVLGRPLVILLAAS